ncbi:putative ankyrin repeat protein [Trypanosoma theileri]|uniref:Putative ankyrin repeat protein n=1 Tax=Trypanosoma theileri TaxID=67003 RepID=A0A1X0NNH1_9TRYP|nr:putative ankyrin repeat protein [Trypanosoma theileri]ORC85679.1 putative ankyrin repeat protein [Trypanosoma theileri]
MATRLEELHNALVNDDLPFFEELLTPQNVNFVDSERRMTLLMWAVRLCKHSIAELLLLHGASLYPQDMFYFNVLHYAAWCADVKMMEILLFSSPNYTDIGMTSVSLGHSSITGLRFRPGVKTLVDLPHSYSGRTPLMFASMRGDVSMVEFLVTKAGADICLKDSNGNTAMDLAANCGHKSVVTFFLSKCDDKTDLMFDSARRRAEENCEKAMTIKQLAELRELNALLCRDWLPQSFVGYS